MNILYVWEIGDGYGHLQNLVAVADAVGLHEATFAVPAHAEHAADYLSQRGYDRCVKLPAIEPMDWERYGIDPEQFFPASFADVLAILGFDRMNRLRPRIDALWPLIAAAERAVTESAPTACMLAPDAIGTGTSWGLPPRGASFPALSAVAPMLAEDRMLAMLVANGLTDRTILPDAIAPARTMPLCYPGLDVYLKWRAPDSLGVGPAVTFRDVLPAPGRQRFAYLDAQHPGIDRILAKLDAANVPCVAHVKGCSTYRPSGSLALIGAFDLREQLARADEVIHHGSAGLIHAAVESGRPQVCFPYHPENVANTLALLPYGTSIAFAPDDRALDGLDNLAERPNKADELRKAVKPLRGAASVADALRKP